jgi:predicted membrane protein
VLAGSYTDLFAGIGTAAATLTGLLFVAVSVSESHAKSHPIVREFRAAAALLAFINALAVSLFGLVPGNNIGYPAAVLGVVGILFAAAGLRTIAALSAPTRVRGRQIVLITALLVMFGVELAYGIALIVNPSRLSHVATIGDVLIASLLIGIARAWELVGGWNAGIWSSLAVLGGIRSRHDVDLHVPDDAEPVPGAGEPSS